MDESGAERRSVDADGLGMLWSVFVGGLPEAAHAHLEPANGAEAVPHQQM